MTSQIFYWVSHTSYFSVLSELIGEFISSVVDEYGGKQWQCVGCSKMFKQKCHLVDHVEGNHLTGLSYPCPYCTQFVKSKHCLRTHVVTHHRDEHRMRKVKISNISPAVF